MTVALLSAVGCHRHHTSTVVAVAATVPSCDPAPTPLDPRADVGLLAGTFIVTFVPTAGTRAGQPPVAARLETHAQDSALVVVDQASRIAQPVVGAMTVDIARLGATAMGEATSTDPASPGVAFYTTRDSVAALTSLVGRVGAQSNRRDLMPIDAGYFALFVRRVAADGFAGGWSSGRGTGSNADASGHFCAVRVAG